MQNLVLVPAGIAAGFVNVVAGGGSLLTMPTLIFLGLDAATANGSNRIALMGQNIVAIFNFRKSGLKDLRTGILLGIPATIGAMAGAQIAVNTDDMIFRRILSCVMLVLLVGIAAKSRRKQPKPAISPTEPTASHSGPQPAYSANAPPHGPTHPHRFALQLALFVFVGIYGGFVQAGVGYLVIFSLTVLGNLSLVRTNSIKVVVIGLYMLPSLLVFAANGKLAWAPGLVLTIGNSIGGWLGTRFTVSKGDRWIRRVLLVAIGTLAIKLMLPAS